MFYSDYPSNRVVCKSIGWKLKVEACMVGQTPPRDLRTAGHPGGGTIIAQPLLSLTEPFPTCTTILRSRPTTSLADIAEVATWPDFEIQI